MTQEELDAAVNRLISESNALTEEKARQYEANISKITGRALKNRTARSTIYERSLAELKSDYARALKKIQDDLDESLAALYLENEEGGGGEGSADAPYEVDYSLPMRDRYVTVKNYYLAYENRAQAISDLQNDEVAKDYLGSYYDYLMQLLKTA